MDYITIKKKKRFLRSQHAFILQLPGLLLVCLNGSLRTKKILWSRSTTFSASGPTASSDHNIYHTPGTPPAMLDQVSLECLVVFGNVHVWWARREAQRLLTSLYSSHLVYFRCGQRLLISVTWDVQIQHLSGYVGKNIWL